MLPKGPRRNPPALERALRKLALAFPEAKEEFPWGERAFKVKKKVFVFLGSDGDSVSMSVKLPESHEMALEFPFASSTGYGLGRSGWVTVTFGPDDEAPLFLLEGWIAESYRAIAPRKLSDAIATPTARVPAKAKAPASKRPRRTP